jgi:toxin ParE1/3/4
VAAKLRRAPRAIADAEEIWFAIAADDVRAADRVAARIYDAELRIADFPEIGRTRDELVPGVRSWVVGAYVIFYAVASDAVVMLRIIHGARDMGDVLSEP